jgi:hypothetical protein
MPLVNCGPCSNFLYIDLPFYYYSLCLLFLHTIILLPLDTLNPLFTANQWDWQPHQSWEQSSWLCCVQVSCCCWWKATRRQAVIWRPCPECHEASKHHLLKFGFLLLVRFNLGFITEGNLLLCSSKPSSWGSQLGALTSHHHRPVGPAGPAVATRQALDHWPGHSDRGQERSLSCTPYTPNGGHAWAVPSLARQLAIADRLAWWGSQSFQKLGRQVSPRPHSDVPIKRLGSSTGWDWIWFSPSRHVVVFSIAFLSSLTSFFCQSSSTLCA